MRLEADIAPIGISADAIGLILLLLFAYLAITVIDAVRPPTLNLAGSVPLIGAGLRGAVDSAFGVVRGWLYSTMSGGLGAFSALVGWLQGLWSQLAATVGSFAQLVYAADVKILHVVLPAAITASQTYLSGLVADARAYALALVTAEGIASARAVAAVESEAQALGREAINYAADVGLAVESESRALFTAAETDARALAVAALDEASALVGLEHKFALSVYAGAIAADHSLEAALRSGLDGVAAADAAAIGAGVSALEQEIGKLQAVLGGVGVGAIARVITDVALIKALKCIQNCGPLGDLGQLMNTLDAALLIGLAAAWRADQQSANPSYAPAIATAANELGKGVKALIGD